MGRPPLPARPVSPVLRLLMLGPLAVAAGAVFLALTFFGGSTDALFAWRMSPVTAALLGAGYGGSCAMLVLALRARTWEKVRVATAASALFMLLMLGASLLGRRTLHLTGGTLPAFAAAWTWLGVHLLAPLIGLVALGAQWRTAGPKPPRVPRLPWWVAAPIVTSGLAVAVTGLLLYVLPDPAARHWPWAARPLDVRALGAWCVAFGVALLLGWREAELRRVRNGMAALVISGLLGLTGLILHGGQVDWDGPGAWLVVLVLAGFTGLGLSGVGVSALLDPPELPDGPEVQLQ
ncbi:hypothetical protein AB0D08_23980 [Kitasatospora sp. NPDC048540]|uniref:hypothetical protein n=1 Tax=unclassified Kitasatospora TaxID=2633591 RepID=UPI00053B6DC4|nr:hypothetical protein [Kitasatospora sp. MBT63]